MKSNLHYGFHAIIITKIAKYNSCICSAEYVWVAILLLSILWDSFIEIPLLFRYHCKPARSSGCYSNLRAKQISIFLFFIFRNFSDAHSFFFCFGNVRVYLNAWKLYQFHWIGFTFLSSQFPLIATPLTHTTSPIPI